MNLFLPPLMEILHYFHYMLKFYNYLQMALIFGKLYLHHIFSYNFLILHLFLILNPKYADLCLEHFPFFYKPLQEWLFGNFHQCPIGQGSNQN